MKLVLTKAVPTLGPIGTLVDVADGYARNYLVPHGFAVAASKAAVTTVEERLRSKVRHEAEVIAEAETLAKLLESKALTIAAKSGGNGKLFGTVTNIHVAEAIAVAFSVEIDRHKIEVPDNIKSLGSYPVEIKLAKNIIAKTTLKVVAATG
ncbi:MAG TPA: 50S ribosomal protein L9 [Candidatus Baltobacteraceae bacterium]|jgi:large subunit ribosomal protein L9|nr:50S ribosomal protein L9 [Candidatus Baltobacteraceae bacterium]